jgi:hypothetical protein
VPAGDTAWRSTIGRDWGFTKSNLKLQKGYVQVGGKLALTGIPYPKYDVYVYLGAGDNTGKGKVSVSPASGGTDAKNTYFYSLAWQGGKFVRATGNSLQSASNSNLVVFSGNSSNDITIDWVGNLEGGWTGVTGIQIVAAP